MDCDQTKFTFLECALALALAIMFFIIILAEGPKDEDDL